MEGMLTLDDIGRSVSDADGVNGTENSSWVMPDEVDDSSTPSIPSQIMSNDISNKPSAYQKDQEVISVATPTTIVSNSAVITQPAMSNTPQTRLSKPIPSSTVQSLENSLIPAVKHSYIGKLIGAIVFLIVFSALVVVGLVYADDKGLLISGLSAKVINLPLSSMWGGLSAKPQTASTQADKALSRVSNMHYTGTIKGWGTTENISGNASDNDPLMTSGDFSFITKGSNFLFSYKAEFGDNQLTAEYRYIDGMLYTGLSTGNTPAGQLEWEKSILVTNLGAMLFKQQMANLISKSIFIAREKLNSGDAYHFKTEIRESDLSVLSDFPSLLNWRNSSGEVDIWVSRKSHILQKFSMSLKQPGAETKTFSFDANVNSSIEDIEVPSIFATSGTNSTATVTKTNDVVRKDDIQKMAVMLNKYYIDRSGYPIAPVIENTSDTKSMLRNTMVPLYVDNIPTDPVGIHYYGYKSDGKSYELTAVLDDTNDTEGMQVGAVFLYKITNLSAPTASPSTSNAN